LYVNLSVYIQSNDMNYSIRFYPEKRGGITENVPIIMSITYASQRLFHYTGKRCNQQQWDADKNALKKNQVAPNGQNSTYFNADLDKIKVTVQELFKAYDVSGVTPSKEQLRENLKKKLGKASSPTEGEGFFDRFEQYIRDSRLSDGFKKHMRTTCNKLRTFNPNTRFEKLTVQYLTDFQNYLLADCNLSKNSAIAELRRLRSFISYAFRHEWTTQNAFQSFRVEAETYGDPVFITTEERNMLFDATIENERLARVRDIFVFQCLIGCRVGDLVKLKRKNIINGFVEYIAGKTQDDNPRVARVPLTPAALTILSRYNLPNGDLLPYITDQRYNEYLKELFRHVGLTRMVTVLDPKTRVSVQKPISEVASSHMARRVFVGNLHRKGVKNEIIASMSGHVENSKALSRYYNINDADKQEALKLIE